MRTNTRLRDRVNAIERSRRIKAFWEFVWGFILLAAIGAELYVLFWMATTPSPVVFK